jgi:hypothetical protein
MDTVVVEVPGASEPPLSAARGVGSGVAWGAVLGGAFVIGAVALLLIALGAGFGLSTVSPWPGAGITVTTFGVMAAIWLVVVQWISSGLGGYVAGRLHTSWTGVHTDEIYFRDTAHGVLAWAVAAVVTAAALAGAAAMLTGGAALGTAAGAAASPNNGAGASTAYFVDTMFRTDRPDATTGGQDWRAEATRIVARSVAPGARVSDSDRTYLAGLVAARTGISQPDAMKRVDDAIANARQATDAARKAAMQFSLLTGFSMLVGAFIAGVAAKIGGHHRDDLAAL